MSKRFLQLACILGSYLLLFATETAFAHESITTGDYELEIGWVDEPPIAGQQNGVELTLSAISSGDALPVEDVSDLEITISYGGQSKRLSFQPLGEDTPGQFMAPLLPTLPGEYQIVLSGHLGDTEIEAEVHPEEVQPADVLHFPRLETVEQESNPGMGDWLTWLAVALGLAGIGLGISAHRRVH